MTKNFPLLFDNDKFLFHRNESFMTLPMGKINDIFSNVTRVNIRINIQFNIHDFDDYSV